MIFQLLTSHVHTVISSLFARRQRANFVQIYLNILPIDIGPNISAIFRD